MKIIRLKKGEDYIKLGQLLKVANCVGSGVEAKMVILDGKVSVNGEIDLRRGRKLYPDDVVVYKENQIKISGYTEKEQL